MGENEDVLIYGLIDPRSGAIRYVGKTRKSLRRRLQEHVSLSRRKKGFLVHVWIRKLERLGLDVSVVLIEGTDEEHWEERERFWISFYKEGLPDGVLLNCTEGGDGVDAPRTKEWYDKIAHSKRQSNSYLISRETREKISRTLLARSDDLGCKRGHPWTKENTRYVEKNGRKYRICKICKNARLRQWRREKGLLKGRRTHCERGHLFEGDNVIIRYRKGRPPGRECRICLNERNRRYKQEARKRHAESSKKIDLVEYRAAKLGTLCKHGHLLDESNLATAVSSCGHRKFWCRTCHNTQRRENRKRKKEKEKKS